MLSLPAGVTSALGRPHSFGLTWLLRCERQSDALALVLTKALMLDLEPSAEYEQR
jgi:hypothetical protein